MYCMELALIMYLCANDYHARFIILNFYECVDMIKLLLWD